MADTPELAALFAHTTPPQHGPPGEQDGLVIAEALAV